MKPKTRAKLKKCRHLDDRCVWLADCGIPFRIPSSFEAIKMADEKGVKGVELNDQFGQ